MKKVITYGTFDLFHQGHINLLRNAKALGDYLIVGVTSKEYDHYRGKLNVQQSVLERIENVRACGIADEIIVEEYEGQKIDDIVRMDVDIFAIGSDWVGRFDYLNEFCQVIYLERTKGISSTQLRDQQHPLIHLGIVGTGRIANRFIVESKFVSGVSVDNVFNIFPEEAKSYAQRHGLSAYFDQYEEFLEHVNAVYIATPHNTHYDYAKRALLAGKHVLCEKPMALKLEEVKELFTLANERGLIIMEAVKTAYCPGFIRLASSAKSGKIGRIVHVEAAFTKLVPSNVREMQNDGVGGSMTELATYPLLAVLKLLGCSYDSVNFVSYRGGKEDGVDLFTQGNFVYPNAVATIKVGLGVKSEGSLVISGTRGYIYVPAPWWKTEYFEMRYEKTSDAEKNFYKFSGDGLRYELVEFLNQISTGKMDRGACEISCAMAKVMETYRSGEHTVNI